MYKIIFTDMGPKVVITIKWCNQKEKCFCSQWLIVSRWKSPVLLLSRPESLRLLLPDHLYESAVDRGRTELRADSLIPGIAACPASGIRISLMWCININILMELFFKIYLPKRSDWWDYSQKSDSALPTFYHYLTLSAYFYEGSEAPVDDNEEDYWNF